MRSGTVPILLLVLGVFPLGLASNPGNAATTIDFDQFEEPGSGFVIHPDPLDIGEYRFTSVDFSSTPLLTTFQQGSAFYNGSAALSSGNGSDIILTRADGGAFDALSLDLDSWQGEHTIELTGELSGGGTVQQIFTTDLVAGGQTLALSGFTSITSLRFDAEGAVPFSGTFGQIDNLLLVAREPVNGFPKWEERVMLQWHNRARSDPQLELASCSPGDCPDAYCYAPVEPLQWTHSLNRAARFHSDQLELAGCSPLLRDDSPCTLVSNIDSLYPDSCDGSASCACEEGSFVCGASGTSWSQRLALFGVSLMGPGENVAWAFDPDPDLVYRLWMFESAPGASCGGGVGNGHRRIILSSSFSSVGAGASGVFWTVNFSADATPPRRIPSGAHYPRQDSSVELWANWFDAAGPRDAVANVGGSCTPMTLERGTAQNGAWSATANGVGSGCHRYVFEFRDSTGDVLSYPTTGSFGIGPAGSCADWDATRPAPCLTTPAVPSIHPLALYTLVPGVLIGLAAMRLRS
ncbi:MAG: hypothetical protein JRG92_20750 [Deltaproteobacteria bacterium]|nr:hypothetical protein [Deltaproteobacteria bacterium]MBW2386069.1 hypothetical protein [Deltaproteobacteria bacterium]MBW2697295.1 hypothetical protein [Deltaproteobacteria bacterium]